MLHGNLRVYYLVRLIISHKIQPETERKYRLYKNTINENVVYVDLSYHNNMPIKTG